MHDNDFTILTIDTAGRDAKLALLTCPQSLSVERSAILDHLIKSEKCDESVEPDSGVGNFRTTLIGLFKQCFYAKSFSGKQSPLPFSLSQTLIPEIGKLLADHGHGADDVDLVIVALGPGSFTGLRIGVVAAKTFAYSTGCDLVGVDLMEAAAHQADWLYRDRESPCYAVAVNAGRGDLLTASYQRNQSGELRQAEPARICKPRQWVQSLPADAIVTGAGVELLDETQLQDLGLEVVGEAARTAAIEALALLGLQQFRASGTDNQWTMQPIYSRPSAAEETAAKSNIKR